MNAFVISTDLAESRAIAMRCIASGQEHGVKVQRFPGFSPKDHPQDMFRANGLDPKGFCDNPYSRIEPCMATFLSHRALWQRCVQEHDLMLILEHDAVFENDLPVMPPTWRGCCTLGRPSFGAFKSPRAGLGPLTSKAYFPGAHAYLVHPAAAQALLDKSTTEAEPTDIYLNLARFPWLTEWYPWPIKCDDTFSTIQKPLGCKAKHNEVRPI